MALKIIEIK